MTQQWSGIGDLYRGDGSEHDFEAPLAPPWRSFPRTAIAPVFQSPEGLPEAVNAALVLRRPLLVTGAPGSGKSTIVESVATELRLGEVLRWHITSRSTLTEALYRYDPLGRIHAQRLQQDDTIGLFIQLGPLGTALLPADRPKALLIDEIDKSDLDLASDLLDVLERGEFEILELARLKDREPAQVRRWADGGHATITAGRVSCTAFPFIVMTSNGERDFPAPFLRRCVRYTMPEPTMEMINQVVQAHLGAESIEPATQALITEYLNRLGSGEQIAIDQLLNTIYLLSGREAPTGETRAATVSLLMRNLLEG